MSNRLIFRPKSGIAGRKEGLSDRNRLNPGSTAYDIVKKYTEEKIGKFTGADVVVHCPSIGRSSALAALKKLTEEGLITREGSGRNTFYYRADSK